MAFGKPRNIPLILKLSVMISLLAIGAISVVSVVMLQRQSELHGQQVDDFARAMARQLASSVNEPLFTDDHLSLQLMTNNFAKLPRVTAAAIVDSNQRVLAEAGVALGDQHIASLLWGHHRLGQAYSRAGDNGIVAAIAAVDHRHTIGGYVLIQLQSNTLVQAYTRSLLTVLLAIAVVSILALLAAYAISRYVSRPINKLLEATERIGQGTFSVDSRALRNDELGKLTDAINDMGQDLFKKAQVESLLNQFLAKDIASKVINQLETVKADGEQVEATVLFVDIVGFTAMSEDRSPEQVAVFLNEYFSYFITCAQFYFGRIDKFIGDCAMVVFGAPKEDADHQFQAIACAVLMQKLIGNINQLKRREGEPEVHVRIGVNSGKMLAGVLGTRHKKEYTVVGDSVNLASRLCSEAGPDQIISTRAICEPLLCDHRISAKAYKNLRVRGKNEAIDTFIVDGVRREYQLAMDGLIEDIMHTLERQ